MSVDQPISAFDNYTTPITTDQLAIVDITAGETKRINFGLIQSPWIAQVDADGNNFVNVGYQDFDRIAIPANPAADHGRMYHKQIDSNNDGLFIKLKQAGSIVEVQIV